MRQKLLLYDWLTDLKKNFRQLCFVLGLDIWWDEQYNNISMFESFGKLVAYLVFDEEK